MNHVRDDGAPCALPIDSIDNGGRQLELLGESATVAVPPARFAVTREDAVAWLRGLPSASVDLVVTDPAYESLEKHRAVGTTTRLKHSKASSNAWFEIFPNDRFPELFAEVYRVLRPNTHFYLFCDSTTMFVAKPFGEAAGFTFWKPLIFDKKRIGMGYHYRGRYENILFFEKGKRKLNNLGIADIIEAPAIRNGYPTEKPVHVSRVLIEQSTVPGELVIDPFMGSASSGVAALELGRRFAGCDVAPDALEVATQRLADAAAGRIPSDRPALPSGARPRRPARERRAEPPACPDPPSSAPPT